MLVLHYTLRLGPSRSYEEALDRVASLWGIEPEFFDIWGNLHVTSSETKRFILGAMGVAADTRDQLDQTIESRLRREWTRSVPPCLVLSEALRPRQFPIQASTGEAAAVTIRHEDGALDRYDVPFGALPEAESVEFDGVRYTRRL